jgi:hypothetical protein
MHELRSDDAIDELLRRTRSVAVVGVSPDPGRPSHSVAAYLIGATGWTVHLVNPSMSELFGRPVHASLADLPEPPDVVDVFRRADRLREVTREATAAGAGALWFQLGLVDDTAAGEAAAAGLAVVQNRCLRVEYARWRQGVPTR